MANVLEGTEAWTGDQKGISLEILHLEEDSELNDKGS